VRTSLVLPFRRRFAASVVLLLAEVAALTPWVEFTAGPIEYLANARLCAGVLFAIVTFGFLIQDGAKSAEKLSTALPPRQILLRLALNLLLYAGFFGFTLWLSRELHRAEFGWLPALLWLGWALTVGSSCFLTFSSSSELAFLVIRPGCLLIAFAAGASLLLLTPAIWRLWPYACWPALRFDQMLLGWIHSEAVLGVYHDGLPVLGTRKMLLLITPQCSELDALLAFWLLIGTMMAARWHILSILPCIAVLVVGTAVLYFLLALRLLGLVSLGIAVSPSTAVSMAHSRVGSIALLGTAVALTWFMLHACRRRCTNSLST
jgi:hypothetical protein